MGGKVLVSCNSMGSCVLGCMLACCFVLSCLGGVGLCLQHVFRGTGRRVAWA